MAEPLSYTRATLDDLKRSIALIAYVLGLTISILSFAYYVYAIVIQAINKQWVLFGVYTTIAVISVVLIFIYAFKKKMTRNFEQKWGYDFMHAIMSWCLIALRGVVLGFSLYEIFAIGVSDLELLFIIFLALMWLVQIAAELLKAFIIHYIALFSVAFEKDKSTLAKDVWETSKPVIKEKVGEMIREKMPWGKKPKEEPKEPETPIGKHKKALLDELENSLSRFRSRRLKGKFGKKSDPEPLQIEGQDPEPMEVEVVDGNKKK